MVVNTGPPQVILEGKVTGATIHITSGSELMLRVFMEFLVAGQTVLCQGQVHLPRDLLLGIEYVKALALFAQDSGRPEKLIEPESKRSEPVLQGSVSLEGILSLHDTGIHHIIQAKRRRAAPARRSFYREG